VRIGPLTPVTASAGRDGREKLSVRFSPRLEPLARRLRLTWTGSAERITIDVD
jgi:hypothetical protein